jgi:hypothetical protein
MRAIACASFSVFCGMTSESSFSFSNTTRGVTVCSPKRVSIAFFGSAASCAANSASVVTA